MITENPNDPRLGRGSDETPVPQNDAYLVIPEADRKNGWVRPYRDSYRHVGLRGPKYPLRDLTQEERERYAQFQYVKFEEYPESGRPAVGNYWTQARLDAVNKGCGVVTKMGSALAETYARNPRFYGATYCVHCSMHRPVEEFVWEGTEERVGS